MCLQYSVLGDKGTIGQARWFSKGLGSNLTWSICAEFLGDTLLSPCRSVLALVKWKKT